MVTQSVQQFISNEIKISRSDNSRLNALPIMTPSTADIKQQTKNARINAASDINFHLKILVNWLRLDSPTTVVERNTNATG